SPMENARPSRSFTVLARFFILVLVAGCLFSSSVRAQPPEPSAGSLAESPAGSGLLPRIAVAEFVLLDDDGEFVPRLEAPDPDLARLARLIPTAIAARLVQSMDYDVLELDARYNPFATPPGADAAAVPE